MKHSTGSRKIAAAAAVCCAILAATSRANADDGQDQRTLMARYSALKMAMALQDVAGVRNILAPEFQLTDATGVTKDSAAVLNGVKLAATESGAVGDAQIQKLRHEGRNIVLTVQNSTQVRDGKQSNAGGPVEVRALTEDEWTPRHGAWYLLRSTTKYEDLYINGALINHRVPPSFE